MEAVIFDLDKTVFSADDTPHGDMVALLNILRRLGIKIGALTTGDHRMLVRLDEAGIRDQFDGIICTAHIEIPKDVEGVRHLLRSIDADASNTAIVSHVSDDMTLGKRSGLAKTIHVTHSQASAIPHRDADHTVTDIPAILDVLE